MPKYEVTAPDGRKFRISGESAPNEQQLREIFAGMSNGNSQSMPNLLPLTDEQRTQSKIEAERIRPKREGLKLKDVLDVAEAVGKGGAYAGSRILSGATLGATDWLDRKIAGGSFEQLGNEVAQNAKNGGKVAEIGNTIGNLASEIGGNIGGAGGAIYKAGQKYGLKGLKLAMGTGAVEGAGYGATESDNLEELPWNVAERAGLGAITGAVGDKIAAPILNKGFSLGSKGVDFAKQTLNNYQVKRGVGKLTKMLERGKGFEDVSFGKVTNDNLDELNRLRDLEGVVKIDGNRVTIPADRVEHLHIERVLGDGYDPKEVSKVLKSAIYDEGNVVSRQTNNKMLQAVLKNDGTYENIGIVGRHRENGGVYVKTGFKTRPEKVTNRFADYQTQKSTLNGRPVPLSEPLEASGSGLSARQGTESIVSQNGGVVNKDVENVYHLTSALGDNQQVRALKKGVEASDDVARRVYDESSIIASELDKEATKSLQSSLFRDIDIEKALENEGKRYQAVLLKQGKEQIYFKGRQGRVEKPTGFQKKTAKQAMAEADELTNYPQGTVAHTNKIKQALNAIKNDLMARGKAPAKIRQTDALLEQVNETLRANSTIKFRDAKYARTARAKDAYEAGKSYTHSLKSNIDAYTPLEKQAFAQGFAEKVVKDAKGGSVAKAIKKNEVVFRSVLPPRRYKRLMDAVNGIDLKYGQLDKIAARAEYRLHAPERSSFFGREVLESKGSMFGHAVDRTLSSLNRKANTSKAFAVMDGKWGTYAQIAEKLERAKATELARLLGAYTGATVKGER